MMSSHSKLLVVDLLLIALATVLGFVFRDNVELIWEKPAGWLIYTSITVALSFLTFTITGTHRSVYRFTNINDYLWVSTLAVMVVVASVATGFLVNRLDGVARTLPVLQAILMVALLVVARVGYRLYHARRSASQRAVATLDDVEQVLVVGINSVADLFLRSVADLANGHIRIVGIVSIDGEDLRGRTMGAYPILGPVTEIEDVLRQLHIHGVEVDRLIVTVAEELLSAADRASLARLQTSTTKQLDFFADKIGLRPARPRTILADETVSATGASGAAAGGPSGSYRIVKRLFDVTLAATLLVLLWPLILIVAATVWFDVGRPLLFWQQRPGQGGRPIRVFKFRTMRGAHDPSGRRVADHARVSAIGSMLRARRLDELPQLFNILVGDMSFVGPRPLLPIDQPEDRSDRLRAKPGLTGWAQVMGGRDITAADKAALDRWYVDRMSLRLDIEIIVRTIPTVLFGEKVHPAAIRQACDALGRSPDLREACAIPPARPLAVAPTAGDTLATGSSVAGLVGRK